MAKYSYEFKQKVVKEYLNGEGSYAHLAKKYNIPSSTPIKEWVALFKEFGIRYAFSIIIRQINLI